jgi:hypothetical protein
LPRAALTDDENVGFEHFLRSSKPIDSPPYGVADEAAGNAEGDRNDKAENAADDMCVRQPDEKLAYQPNMNEDATFSRSRE